jgi:hypothetical protein
LWWRNNGEIAGAAIFPVERQDRRKSENEALSMRLLILFFFSAREFAPNVKIIIFSFKAAFLRPPPPPLPRRHATRHFPLLLHDWH